MKPTISGDIALAHRYILLSRLKLGWVGLAHLAKSVLTTSPSFTAEYSRVDLDNYLP